MIREYNLPMECLEEILVDVPYTEMELDLEEEAMNDTEGETDADT